jgi:hypothetical protein
MGRLTDTPIAQAIGYGIHAPNPHNTQAWKFELLSERAALLYIDERRLLPAADPRARQIHIGAGCCLETIAVAMSSHGFDTDVEYLPSGAHGLDQTGRQPVARVSLRPSPSARPDSLANFIHERQTNRRPYNGPLLRDHEVEQIRSLAPARDFELLIVSQPEAMRPLLDIFYRAQEIEVGTRRVHDETRRWFRFNEKQRRSHRDGLSIPQIGTDGWKGRLIEWTLLNGSRAMWFSPLSTRSVLKTYRAGIESARAVALLKTRTNDQLDWLKVGRGFARFQLALTSLGLTCHPYSQVLQEYPEMAQLQAEFNRLLGVQGAEKIQMAVRIGRAQRAYVAPRRDAEELLIDRPS